MTKVDLTPGFLIHRRAYRNNSLLLDFLTLEHGKIRLVGRGTRQAKTAIQMFGRVNISFSGRGELKTLTQWESDDIPRRLTGETLILGLYANELIDRLLHDHDSHPLLFKVYQTFLSRLDNTDDLQQQWALRIFENQLLSELGYGLEFEYDSSGNPINELNHYQYQHQLGFTLSETGKILGKFLTLFSSADIKQKPDKSSLRIYRDLNRQRLAPLLGDKPLKSRELYFKESIK